MSNSKKKVKAEDNPNIIVIDGKDVVISKLKAGKYFKAQKIFMELLGGVQNVASAAVESDGDQADAQLAIEIMQVMPDRMLAFVAICLDMTEDELGDSAEPTEIPIAFEKIVALNNFIKNIKNFVAPMQSLGQGM